MNDDLNWLLTDEFVTFSVKIKDILDRKKAKKGELKAFYEKIQVDFKEFDDEAATAKEEFETFKKGYPGPVQPIEE